MIPDDGIPATLDAITERAREILPPEVYRYFASGAGDELTMRRNREAWAQLLLRQRAMRDVSTRDLSVSVLGQTLRHPLVMAPMAWQTLAHPGGEIAAANGVAAAGGVYTLSCWASQSIADVAGGAADATKWMHLHLFPDRDVTRRLVEKAEDAGFRALLVTVDQPVAGRRDRAIGANFERPPSPNVVGLVPGGLDAGQTWDDLGELAAGTRLPVVAKGVLDEDDVDLAVEVGLAGIVVSNHGGRQLDTVPATADVLAGIVDRAAGRLDVLVDGGIGRGTDVLKALAAGARAVLVGRQLLWGLACGGAAGVERAMELLVTEFDLALAITGQRSARELTRDAMRAEVTKGMR